MAQYAPQYSLYKIIDRIDSIMRFAFWSVLILSISSAIFQENLQNIWIWDIINIVNVTSIVLFFILEIIIDQVLMPQADNKRRDDFIDNSLGSKFSANSSLGYYDNEELSQNLYKVAVNLFENCFFTFHLVKIISAKKIVIPAIVTIIIAIFAYYGFEHVPFALTILQAFFSANILGALIKHLILLNRLSAIYDSWILLFQKPDLKSNIRLYETYIYRFWLQYETLHSKIPSGVGQNTFDIHNSRLTNEWSNFKVRYSIS